jgi:hypothetical protein
MLMGVVGIVVTHSHLWIMGEGILAPNVEGIREFVRGVSFTTKTIIMNVENLKQIEL